MTRLTKEEKFAVCLHQLGGEATLVAIGEQAGLTERNLKKIARDLAQTNFIKKREEETVYLTPQGIALVEELL